MLCHMCPTKAGQSYHWILLLLLLVIGLWLCSLVSAGTNLVWWQLLLPPFCCRCKLDWCSALLCLHPSCMPSYPVSPLPPGALLQLQQEFFCWCCLNWVLRKKSFMRAQRFSNHSKGFCTKVSAGVVWKQEKTLILADAAISAKC